MHRSGYGNCLGRFAMLLRKHVVYIKDSYTCRGLVGFTRPIQIRIGSRLHESQIQFLHHLVQSCQKSLRVDPGFLAGNRISHTQSPVPYVIALSIAPRLYSKSVNTAYSIRFSLRCPSTDLTIIPFCAASTAAGGTVIPLHSSMLGA